MKIPEKLTSFIQEEAEKHSYELVDISTGSGRNFSLEIVLDKKGGISMDDCVVFNRLVMSWIDEEKMFKDGCALDVCSPGLNRALKDDRAFLWAVGRQIKVNTHEPVGTRNTIIGKLLKASAQEDDIVIEKDDGNTVCVKKSDIATAKLNTSIV